ncbi:MAG TPA: Gfo/Idh/MocA family oxidoreductase [Phycisphaerae bacterium]|nr:Gfo/Idh/MocA family oxidoreductase [Phycisphaerae bacterium]
MIKLGIIGTGSMANNHAAGFKVIRGVKLTACCDIVKKTARDFAKRYEIANVYTDYEQMLRDVPLDAVSIVVNDKFHAPIAIAAAKKGLHVLCEKPLATNPKDAWEMVKAAKKAGVINMVNFCYRRSSGLQRAREMVQAGKIGDLRYVEAHHLQSWLTGKHWGNWKKTYVFLWRLSKNHDSTGALGDIGCHILDLTTFVAGDIKSVYCKLKNFDKGVKKPYKGFSLDANDSAHITAEFANGATGTINATRWATGQMDSLMLQVHGTKGAVKVDLDGGENKLWVSVGEDIDKPRWKAVSCGRCVSSYQKFIKSIQTGKNDTPDFEVGAKVQEYIEKCFQSDKQRKPITLRSK